jgi:hypothetical protein
MVRDMGPEGCLVRRWEGGDITLMACSRDGGDVEYIKLGRKLVRFLFPVGAGLGLGQVRVRVQNTMQCVIGPVTRKHWPAIEF